MSTVFTASNHAIHGPLTRDDSAWLIGVPTAVANATAHTIRALGFRVGASIARDRGRFGYRVSWSAMGANVRGEFLVTLDGKVS